MTKRMGISVWFVLAACATAALPASGLASVLSYEAGPLLTTSGEPGGFEVAPGGPYDGVARIYVVTPSGSFIGTASLLSGGTHLLTAAHMVTDGAGNPDATAIYVLFDRPGVTTLMSTTAYTVHPDWDGDFFRGNDLAVIELPIAAPDVIPQYGIYEGTDEVGQNGVKVGYGASGNGRITIGAGTKRSGQNQYDATGDLMLTALGLAPGTDFVPGAVLQYDFDNGEPENDAFGFFFGLNDLGLGPGVEVSAAPGDSGGPTFFYGKIAAVTSYGITLTYNDGTTSDIDDEFNASYGEFGGDTRVSFYSDWLKELVPELAVVPEPASVVVWSLLAGLALSIGLRRGRTR